MPDNTLPSVSLAISIVVIICMTFAFAILFILYTFAKNRGIRSGADDDDLKSDLIKDYQKRVGFDERSDESTGETVTVRKMGYCEFLDSKARRSRLPKILTDIIFILILAVIFAISVTAWVFRANGEQFFMGDSAYLTIRSGSMSEINPSNPYADEIPNNQIAEYSLIGIDKIASADELNLYDVIAFKADDGTLYVHRIVGIFSINGQRHFTTLGDANSSSAASELDITFDRIKGKYNGYQSKGLGYFMIYLNSDIGIIALMFALLFILTVDISESSIGKRLKERTYYIAGLLDGGDNEAEKAEELAEAQPQPEPEPEPVVETEPEFVSEPEVEPIVEPEPEIEPEQETVPAIEPQASAPEQDFDDELIVDGYNVVRYDRSFTAKLTKSNDVLKGWYSAIKNELLSYPKVKASMSWRYESFTLGRKRVARLAIRGTTLCVYLALSPQDYAETKYKVEDVSEQASLGELKSLYRIKNERRAKYVKALIADVMKAFDVTKGAQSEQDWYLPYNGDAVLLQNGLIKRKVVKVLSEGEFFAGAKVEGKQEQTEADGENAQSEQASDSAPSDEICDNAQVGEVSDIEQIEETAPTEEVSDNAQSEEAANDNEALKVASDVEAENEQSLENGSERRTD